MALLHVHPLYFLALLLSSIDFACSVWLRLTKPRTYRQQLDNIGDLSYYGNLTVGGQPMRGVFDTGSIELVVLSENCSRCGDNGTKQLYNNSLSPRYVPGNTSTTLSYGSGQLSGNQAYDSVAIGPFVSIRTPFWEVVDAMMPLLFTSDFDAIVGLGPIPLSNSSNSSSLLQHDYAVLLDSLNLTNFQYSVCLGMEPGSPGFLTWNDRRVTQVPAAFKTLQVEGTGFWMTKLEDVQLGSIPLACAGGCGAILDSGTSLIAMPDGVKSDLISLVLRVMTDCSNASALPDLRFKLSGVEYSLPPDTYLAEVVGNTSSELSGAFQASKKSPCEVAVMTVDMESSLGETWILGMPFFRYFYTVFAQATASAPPKMYTAKAEASCYPMEESNTSSLQSHGRARVMRRVNASHLRLPPWVHRARVAGHSQE